MFLYDQLLSPTAGPTHNSATIAHRHTATCATAAPPPPPPAPQSAAPYPTTGAQCELDFEQVRPVAAMGTEVAFRNFPFTVSRITAIGLATTVSDQLQCQVQSSVSCSNTSTAGNVARTFDISVGALLIYNSSAPIQVYAMTDGQGTSNTSPGDAALLCAFNAQCTNSTRLCRLGCSSLVAWCLCRTCSCSLLCRPALHMHDIMHMQTGMVPHSTATGLPNAVRTVYYMHCRVARSCPAAAGLQQRATLLPTRAMHDPAPPSLYLLLLLVLLPLLPLLPHALATCRYVPCLRADVPSTDAWLNAYTVTSFASAEYDTTLAIVFPGTSSDRVVDAQGGAALKW